MEMRLSIFIALVIFLFNFLLLFIGSFTKRKVSKNLLFCIAISNILAFSLIGYKIYPSKSTDLYKHVLTVISMINGGFFTNTAVDNLITIKIIFYLISLTGNVRLIPVVSAVITYSTFYFLLSRENDEKHFSIFLLLYSIISFYALCSNYYVFTGIKTSISFSFLNLFIYNYNKNNKKASYLFAVLSIFSHASSFIFIVLFILFKKNKTQSRIFWIFMALPIVYRLLFVILPMINIPFVSYLWSKIQMYSADDFISSKIEIFIIDLLYCIFLYFRYNFSLKHCDNKERTDEIIILKYYCLFILLSSIISKIMIERGLILLSFLNFKNIIEEKKHNRFHLIIFLIDIIYFTLKIYYFVVRLLSHAIFY